MYTLQLGECTGVQLRLAVKDRMGSSSWRKRVGLWYSSCGVAGKMTSTVDRAPSEEVSLRKYIGREVFQMELRPENHMAPMAPYTWRYASAPSAAYCWPPAR